MFARLTRLFRPNAGKALREIGLANERARRRAVVDAMRASLRAKGHANMTPIDWASLKGN